MQRLMAVRMQAGRQTDRRQLSLVVAADEACVPTLACVQRSLACSPHCLSAAVAGGGGCVHSFAACRTEPGNAHSAAVSKRRVVSPLRLSDIEERL